jgi:hypothetical protein
MKPDHIESASFVSTDPDAAAIRGLDRFVVPGRNGRAGGAAVLRAVATVAPAVEPTYLRAEAPERFGLEPVLEDLARTADQPTARFALRRLEYRSDTVRLEGERGPLGILPLPLALGAIGVLLARAVDHRLTRRRRPTAR